MTIESILHVSKALEPKRDADLRWHDIDDLGDRNWCLQIGYLLDWDDGNAEIWVFKVYLNTGQRDLELQLNEVELSPIEAAIRIEEEARRDAEASERVYDRDDKGDWLYEQRKASGDESERHVRVITGTGNASERKELAALCAALKVSP